MISVPMIIGEIKRFLRDNSTLRVSRTLKDIAYKALKLKEINQGEEIPTEKLAQLIGVSEEELESALKAVCEPFSLNESIESDEGDNLSLIERIKDEGENEESWIEGIGIMIAVKGLNQKEKQVIDLRYYKGKTQVQVAKMIGISQAQVSRIEKSALERIKKHL